MRCTLQNSASITIREKLFLPPLCCELLLYCENASWLPCIFHWVKKKQQKKTCRTTKVDWQQIAGLNEKKKIVQRGSVENIWKKQTIGKNDKPALKLTVFFFCCALFSFQSSNRSGCAHWSDCDSLYRQHYHPGVGCRPGSHRPLHGHFHIVIWRHYWGEDLH